eukprot:scaffold1736_cov127-Cylindrotheca_fusiformis.AAC.94
MVNSYVIYPMKFFASTSYRFRPSKSHTTELKEHRRRLHWLYLSGVRFPCSQNAPKLFKGRCNTNIRKKVSPVNCSTQKLRDVSDRFRYGNGRYGAALGAFLDAWACSVNIHVFLLKKFFSSGQSQSTLQQYQQENDIEPTNASDDLTGREIYVTSDADDQEHWEEQQEIEMFLEEMRKDAENLHSTTVHCKLTAFASSVQRLSVLGREHGNSIRGEGKIEKGRLFLYQETEDIEQSAVSEATLSVLQSRPQCAICLVEYQENDDICWSHNKRCNHHYHRKCMIEWLSDHDECPCCRNNYLALSDDDEPEEENHSSIPEDTFSHLESPTASSDSSGNPFVFHSLESVLMDAADISFPDLEQGRDSDIASAGTSSSAGTVYTQRESWNGDGNIAEDALHNGSTTDDWSCPSVQDLEEPVNDSAYLSPRRRQRRRPQHACRLQQREEEPSDNQETFSLQLDDLIVDGLMRRLEEKGDRHRDCSNSNSSGSVYTEGSVENSDPIANGTNAGLQHLSVDETRKCAICTKEYEMNEQICWSTDPLCLHVFHRECLSTWIADGHAHCPLCKAKKDGVSVASILSPGKVATASVVSYDRAQAASETMSAGPSVEALESDFDIDSEGESDHSATRGKGNDVLIDRPGCDQLRFIRSMDYTTEAILASLESTVLDSTM